MKIRNKLESDKIIIESGINYIPFINVFNVDEAIKAAHNIPEPIGFRAKKSFGGNVIGNMTRKQALSYIRTQKDFSFPYSVYQDNRAIGDFLIYQGEIQLHKDGTMCGIYCNVPGIINRYAVLHSEAIHFGMYYNSPYPQKEVNWGWRPVRLIVDYLCKYNIIGPVVEFSYFTTPLGIKNEPIVIWEIRNY